MLSPFAWLRRKAAEAVALGVADALTAVTPESGEDPPPDLASLRALAAGQAGSPRQLAPPEEEPSKARGRSRHS